MTNPQGPPNDGPRPPARPSDHDPFSPQRWTAPQGDLPPEAPTQASELPQQPPQPPTTSAPAESAPAVGSAPAAPGTTTRRPGPRPPLRTRPSGKQAAEADAEAPQKKKRRLLRDPLSLLLIFIILFALIIGGLITGELIARRTAQNKVAEVVACKVKDQATASFAVTPLLLWQLMTEHFSSITVETAGNQLVDAKGMKLQVTIQDVKLNDPPTATSQGTIGALDAVVTWTSDGIRQTIQSQLPQIGNFVARSVIAHPTDGTIELKGDASDITVKPEINNGALDLKIVTFSALDVPILNVPFLKDPKDLVQNALNTYTEHLTTSFPMGIKADSVTVTTSGVTSHFSARNAEIPVGKGDNTQDPCFASI